MDGRDPAETERFQMATVPVGALTTGGRVLGLLVTRDLKVRYASSVLGYAWTVLEPLMMSGVYFFVFSFIIQRDVGAEPYIVFLLAGMLPWRWAQGVIRESTHALTGEAKLVRSAGIRRELWVLRVVTSAFFEYLFALPVLIAFMIILQKGVSWTVVLDFPLAVLIEATLLLGIGMLLAPLTVLYRDMLRVIRPVLRVLFYFSPIIYSTKDVHDRIPEAMSWLYGFNPFVGILDLYRKPIFPGQFSGWVVVAQAAAVAVCFLAVGVWVFRRLEGTVLKEI